MTADIIPTVATLLGIAIWLAVIFASLATAGNADKTMKEWNQYDNDPDRD